MTTKRRQRFIYGQLGGMLLVTAGLTALNSLSYEFFFVCTLLVFLVVLEVTAPFNITPHWRHRLHLLGLIGLLVFGYLVVRRILAILPSGAV